MMPKLILLLITAFFPLFEALAQQIGPTAMPTSRSSTRLGIEAGGYLDRGVGSGAQVRFLKSLGQSNAFELGAGGATGDRGSRAFAAFRRQLVKEDVNFPAVAMRFMAESFGDAKLERRNAMGAGLLFSQGFVVNGQEVYGYLQPRGQIALRETSNEFEFVTASAFGLNTVISQTGRRWIGSMEYDVGFTNSGQAFMLGIATDI
jgi:hypothetical protein